jgi:hypothetical protein
MGDLDPDDLIKDAPSRVDRDGKPCPCVRAFYGYRAKTGAPIMAFVYRDGIGLVFPRPGIHLPDSHM